MKVQTKFFGEMEVSDDDILYFNSGIPGFDEFREYIVLPIEDSETLKCIQCIENVDINLLITSPWNYFPDYEFHLSDDEIKELNINNQEDVEVYNIVTIREDNITANLVAPIVINVIKRMGKQIILSNAEYKVRQEIKCL